jgi:hypothetical protein
MRKMLTGGAGALGFALLLSGCGGTSEAPASAPAGTAAAPASADATAPEPGHTCPATSAQVPSGAHQAATADVDYDGKPDTLWLASVEGKRTLGIRTASGAVFSTTFTSASQQRASALGQKMGDPDASSIVLLHTGQSVKVYTVADCAIVPTTDSQHAQYAFDSAFTGVECAQEESGYQLAGLQASPAGGGDTVYRTPVTLSDYGRHASNGARKTVATDADDDLVKEATSFTCGAGNTAVTEP